MSLRRILRRHGADASWQEPLLAAVAPGANSRILNFGPGSAQTARNLAIRFPTANIVGADPNPKAVEKARRIIARSNIANLTIIDAPRRGRLPFDAGSFDNVVLVLTLHDRVPDEKLEITKEMLRLLRHGGKLHVADYDKPVVRGEHTALCRIHLRAGGCGAAPYGELDRLSREGRIYRRPTPILAFCWHRTHLSRQSTKALSPFNASPSAWGRICL